MMRFMFPQNLFNEIIQMYNNRYIILKIYFVKVYKEIFEINQCFFY
jgi:hypothetical protein